MPTCDADDDDWAVRRFLAARRDQLTNLGHVVRDVCAAVGPQLRVRCPQRVLCLGVLRVTFLAHMILCLLL